ncbi:monosaccharide ABC transporter substrate-binding protein, CUT2 family [Micromonospora viridifaciens]|uniref:Monosaccharide ABC transporter substrate-binding protein, CUT2 family n=1 Tax=Micromonospora viridifaciens TaxID=1881 RepID=A0A1C4YHN1_MICVI|nr:substrate-binding domain-containing protein [Micromonospora viridifaciens]SCF19841.1 monosaccharide ABC transporter substrate-binding protein, CUT2 family [Micromonospora viridifaciens]
MKLSLGRRIAVAATLSLALLANAACGAITPASTASAENGSFKLADYIKEAVKKGEPLKIKLSYHDPSLAFAVPIRQGMERGAKEFGVDVQMIGPSGGNPADQVAELQTLINQKQIHGLAVSSASNDALKPVIAQAYDAGIPIISFNTNNPESKQMGFVGQDLVASGRSLAKELLGVLKGKTGKVVVVSVDSGAGWSNDRFSGFQDGLKDSGLQIVGPVNTGNEPSAAYNTVESTMAAQSDAIALVSLDCCSFTAGAKWLQQSGKAGKIHAVGFDVQPQTVEYLKSGVVDLTISQGPAEQGYQAVKLLADYLKNGTEIKNVDTGALVVTRDTVASVPVEG